MSNGTAISCEETLELFRDQREKALANVHHRIPLYELRKSGMSDTELYALARSWERAGWIEPSGLQCGPSLLGNFKLARKYLAYMPNEDRSLATDKRAMLIKAARDSMAEKGRVVVGKFLGLASKEDFYRLLEDGAIVRHPSGSRHEYFLAPEHRS